MASITAATDTSRYAFDDAHIPFGAVTERAQRVLVSGAVVRGKGLRDARKLDDDDALLEAAFENVRWQTTRDETAAGRLECGAGELRIRCKRRGITYRTVRGNPIRFGHSSSASVAPASGN